MIVQFCEAANISLLIVSIIFNSNNFASQISDYEKMKAVSPIWLELLLKYCNLAIFVFCFRTLRTPLQLSPPNLKKKIKNRPLYKKKKKNCMPLFILQNFKLMFHQPRHTKSKNSSPLSVFHALTTQRLKHLHENGDLVPPPQHCIIQGTLL